MVIRAYKTHKITKKDTDITAILDKYLPKLAENSVVAVTSKIIAICEDRIVPIAGSSKNELVKQEADYYLPKESNNYHVYLTIKSNLLVATAGIDESNSQDYYVLWPENPQESANKIREYLKKRDNLKSLGIIVTDSKTTPLRWGVTGAAISHSGFAALNNKIGTPDIFGREMKVTQVNVPDALAAAATFEMGEANEQTPIAVITKIPQVEFQDRNPISEELEVLHYNMKKDLYAQLLTSVPWQKGKSNKS